MPVFASTNRLVRLSLSVAALVVLGACAAQQLDTAERSDGIYDPYEVQNRKVHKFNKALDKNLIGPSARRFARVVPAEVRLSFNNISDNLSMPAVAVNSLLQGDLRGAGLATARFAINSVIGIGGIADAADEFDVPEHETDFGETLAVRGVGEGAYVELPLFGPSTQRDTVGRVVDGFTNPLTYNLDSPEKYYKPTFDYLARVNDRARYDDTINSILYDSADSYAQARLIYLQNSRFKLGKSSDNGSLDPYQDPYEDPYAQ